MERVSEFGVANRRQLFAGAGLTAAGVLASGLFGAAPVRAAAVAEGGEPLVIMNQRENPFGPSPKAVQAILDHASEANRYADKERDDLLAYIAATENVDPKMILLSNGSKPTLAATGAVFARHGGDLVTADLTYGILYNSAAAFGANLVQVPLTPQWDWDFAGMLSKINAKTCGIYLCNPNGSTGRLADTDTMKSFIIEASKYAPVFVDETYLDQTSAYPNNSMMPLVRAGHDVIVSRTLSKLHGLAGQRLGYAIGPVERLTPVKALLTDHVNRAGVVAGLASLKDTENQAAMRVKLARGRQELLAMFDELNLKYVPGSVYNGVLVDFGTPVDKVSAYLLDRKILIGKKGLADRPTWTSICVGTDPELTRFKAGLKGALQAA